MSINNAGDLVRRLEKIQAASPYYGLSESERCDRILFWSQNLDELWQEGEDPRGRAIRSAEKNLALVAAHELIDGMILVLRQRPDSADCSDILEHIKRLQI